MIVLSEFSSIMSYLEDTGLFRHFFKTTKVHLIQNLTSGEQLRFAVIKKAKDHYQYLDLRDYLWCSRAAELIFK